MNVLVPLICLGIAALSLVLRHGKPAGSGPSWSYWLALVVMVVACGLLASHLGPAGQAASLWIGLVIGGLGVAAGAAIERWGPHASALLAVGAAASGFVLLAPALDSAALSAAAAAGLGAMIFRLRSSSLVAVTLSGNCLAAIIGSHSDSSFVHPAAGAVVTAGIALVALASELLGRITPKWERYAPPVIAIVVFAISYAGAVRYLSLGPGWIGLCLAPIAALIAYWLSATSDPKPDAFGLLVSATIWLGLATAAFGLTKAFGVSLALVLAIGTLIALNADRTLVTTGPLLAVVLTQAFRILHQDAAKSIDVGQHYVLIGLVLGALVPLLPEEWLDRIKRPEDWRKAAPLAVWWVVLCAVPVLIGIYLAPRGLIGFVAGLGLSGFFAGLRPPVSLTIPALSAGLGCLTLKAYDWMGDLTGLPRADKVHWIETGGIFLLVAAALLAALGAGRSTPRQTPDGLEAA